MTAITKYGYKAVGASFKAFGLSALRTQKGLFVYLLINCEYTCQAHQHLQNSCQVVSQHAQS